MIGIFDSGLGGLTALKEIRRLFPGEELVYFGDTGRVPYGPRSPETIRKYAMQDLRFLTSFPIRAAVVACGTVSTTSLGALRKAFDIPIIGVVEGAADAAVEATVNHKIAVIGTAATIRSGAFPRAIVERLPDAEVISAACPLFVPLVENGFISDDDPVTALVCKKYLAPVLESGADTLILGCTHYPIIAGAISRALPGVKLISTGKEAAKSLKKLFPEPSSTVVPAPIRYFVSDDTAGFISTASLFLQDEVEGHVEKIDIEKY